MAKFLTEMRNKNFISNTKRSTKKLSVCFPKSIFNFYNDFLIFLTLEKLAHEKDQAKRQISTEHQNFDSYHLSEQLQQVKVELEEVQDNVTNLQLQLQVRDEMVHAASETLLVKVS